MPRPATSSSERGLLLVEAVLSAVVIAAGLVFVSRGLGGQLSAIQKMQEYETLLSLASTQAVTMESERLLKVPVALVSEGVVRPAEPARASDPVYRWTLSSVSREDLLKNEAGEPVMSEVALALQRDGPSAPSVRLRALWSSGWVATE